MLSSLCITHKLTTQCDCEPLIGEKIIELLKYFLNKHSKCLVIRFDLTFPCEYVQNVSNVLISRFIQKLIQKYKRQGYDPYYVWVREQNMSNHPHYHCALFLNGHKVQSFYHVFNNAQNLWSSTLGVDASGQVDHCNRFNYYNKFSNGIMIEKYKDDAQFKIDAVVCQLSYLAKTRDKRDYGDPWRNFGMSELHY